LSSLPIHADTYTPRHRALPTQNRGLSTITKPSKASQYSRLGCVRSLGSPPAHHTPQKKFVGIKFCQECNNMLYPEQKQSRLVFACRNCEYFE